MYAYGCYQLRGYELEILHNLGYELTDIDILRGEIVEPLANIYRKVIEGRLPAYPARAQFERTVARLESGGPPISYTPTWEDLEKHGEDALSDIFMEEEHAWSIFSSSGFPFLSWKNISGIEHGYDPFAICHAMREHLSREDIVVVIDWYASDITVVNSPYVGKRLLIEPVAGLMRTCDAQQSGEAETYVLSPEIINGILEEFVDTIRYDLFNEDPNQTHEPTDKEIAERLIDEFGYIPGELGSRNICISENRGRGGLDSAYATTSRAK